MSPAMVQCHAAGVAAARPEAVAIIPQMGWQELSDEALIDRYRAEAGHASAEQYLNEIFRRFAS
jgi:hypothetical protein